MKTAFCVWKGVLCVSNILKKELRLCASPLSYFFILFSLMFLLPGYPVLCGAFFVTLGIFQSFQSARESGDILFSALLPIAKRDIVKGKYLFACFVELWALLIMGLAVALRMTLLSRSPVYLSNALMNANPFALGLAFLIFGLFNAVFIGGFFKTAYKLARPFIAYIIAAFLVIGAGETLWHLPGLGALNAFGTEHFSLQLLLLFAGVLIFGLLTQLSCKRACGSFEKIDL